MSNSAPSRNEPLTTSVQRIPSLDLNHIALLASQCPCLIAPAAEYARRFFPRATLGRMG